MNTVGKILLFKPYSAITRHNFIEHSISKSFLGNHYRLTHLRCRGMLGFYCFNMYLFGLKFSSDTLEKRRICNMCVLRGNQHSHILANSEYDEAFLDDYESPDEISYLDTLHDVFSTSNPSLVVDGIDFCRLSSYELRLHNALGLEIPPYFWDQWQHQTRVCMSTYFRTKEYLRQNDGFSLGITYNGAYSINSAFLLASRNRGLPTLDFYAAGRPSRMYNRIGLSRSNEEKFNATKVPELWENFCRSHFSLKKIVKTFLILKDHLQSSSNWVFSNSVSREGGRKIRGLIKGRFDHIVLLTLSSSDELIAFEQAGYDIAWKPARSFINSQVSLIHTLVEIARVNPSLLFVVRPHPREFGVKRNSNSANQTSDTLPAILDAFSSLNIKDNIYLNKPDDGIGLYDWLKFRPIVLNLNSSSGLENVALGGITVDVSEGKLTSYPQSINSLSSSSNIADLDHAIQLAMLLEPDWNKVVQAWKWLYFKYYENTVRVAKNKVLYKYFERIQFWNSEKEESLQPTRLIKILFFRSFRVLSTFNKFLIRPTIASRFIQYLDGRTVTVSTSQNGQIRTVVSRLQYVLIYIAQKTLWALS